MIVAVCLPGIPMRLAPFATTISAVALFSAGPGLAQDSVPIRIGQTVSAALTAEDPTSDSGDGATFAYDTYSVRLGEGQRIEATMRAEDFDAYLEVLRDGTEEVLAMDDDGLNEGTDARVRFAAEAAGVYLIRARTLSGIEGGDYTLEVSERAPAPRAPRPTPIRIGAAAEGRLSDSDPMSDDDALYDAYSFRARAGQRYAISLDSEDFDAIVRVGSATRGGFQELASNDDSGSGGLNSFLTFTAPRAGEFIVRAGSLDGSRTGAYTLKVDEAGPAALRIPVAIGDTVEGRLGDRKNDAGVLAATYAFQALAGQRVVATLTSDDFDAFLELFSVAANGTGGRSSVDQDDDGAGEGTHARLAHTFAEDGVYELEARAFNGDGEGAFTLSLEQAPAEPEPSVIELGAVVQGEIADDDVVDDESRAYDAYRVAGRGGNRIQVVMRSGDFDTYVQLGHAEGEFNALASDDDGLQEGTNSRLNFILPTDGDYIVRASPLSSGATGLYSLEITDRGPQPLPGSILVGATGRGVLSDSDALTEDGSPYDAYRITVKADESLRLTLVSNAFDAYLDVGREDDDGLFTSVISDDDGLSDTHARIDWTVEEDGEYVIRARSFSSGQEGAYALTVEPRE